MKLDESCISNPKSRKFKMDGLFIGLPVQSEMQDSSNFKFPGVWCQSAVGAVYDRAQSLNSASCAVIDRAYSAERSFMEGIL